MAQISLAIKLFPAILIIALFSSNIEAMPRNSSSVSISPDDSIAATGLGWATASGALTGATGDLSLHAVSSSSIVITIDQNGNLIVTAGGNGTGSAEGSAQDLSVAALDLHGEGGGSGTVITNPGQDQAQD